MSAYIDNALDDNDRQRLEACLENDPVLACDLENLRRTDALLLAAYDAPMNQAIPKRFFDVLGMSAPTRLPADFDAAAEPTIIGNVAEMIMDVQ